MTQPLPRSSACRITAGSAQSIARRLWAAAFGFGLGCMLVGCASYKPGPSSYQPQVERALTQTNGPIIASAAVLSRSEAKKKFGLPLHKKNIQPVWLRLKNTGTNVYYFLPAGLDPAYHPPSEVAYMHRKALAWKRNRRIQEVMESSRIPLKLPPDSSTEGFVFSNADPGAKHVQLDIIGQEEHYRLEFSVPIPGKRFDFNYVDFEQLYPAGVPTNYTLADFPRVLEQLPVTTTDKSGKGGGDPINLVVVADENNEVGLSFLRNNWDVTEILTFGNALKLIRSFLFDTSWRTSPVSSLYLFGRRQDFALQKARSTIHERNHLRLWLAPFLLEGRYVFVGQISRDIGLRFSFKAPGFWTHKIDPETDEARDYIVQEMLLAGSVSQVAWVGGVGAHPQDAPGRNLTGDPWYTDGYRVVLFLSNQPIPPAKARLTDWIQPSESTNVP